MALVVKDRVKETTSTTGTGTLTLAGAVAKFQSFSVIGDGNTTYYAIESGNGSDWEVGVGTYTASGTTLSRDTILESSNGGTAISLSGTSTVFCTYPAERSVNTADIGTTIQAYDADTAKYDDTTANFTGTLQNNGSNVVVDTDIGSTVQAYDADTTKNDVANTFTANQTINADLIVDTNTLYVDSTNNNVGIGTSSPTQKLDVNGSIRLAGSISGNITISAPAVAGTHTLTLPSTSSTLATQNSLGVRNHIINGDFSIAQRGTSFTSGANNDDAYTLDRWYILSDGNDAIDVTQETSVVPTNELYAIALDVETANKKFGIAQIIEQKNCVGLIGNTVTLSFKAKVSSTTKLDNVKCAIVSWSGTADTVTSDIVSAWGAEGTDPTLIANATYENTPANLNVTTSYATYSVSAAIDTASTKNVIVFIWSDVTDTTAGDFLYVTDVQLEVGDTATPFEHRPYDMELARCYRYYYRVNGFAATQTTMSFGGYSSSTTLGVGFNQFPVTMRIAPTAIEQSGTASHYAWRGTGSNVTFSGVPTWQDVTTANNGAYTGTVSSGLTAGQSIYTRALSDSAYLAWSAEL